MKFGSLKRVAAVVENELERPRPEYANDFVPKQH